MIQRCFIGPSSDRQPGPTGYSVSTRARRGLQTELDPLLWPFLVLELGQVTLVPFLRLSCLI